MFKKTRQSAHKTLLRLGLLTVVGLFIVGFSQLIPLKAVATTSPSAPAVEMTVAQAPTNNVTDSVTDSAMGSTDDTNAPQQTLRVGSRGEAVKQLQTKLQQLGYFAGTVDGVYGNATRQAVLEFQTATGLSGDGIAGAETVAQLQTASPKPTREPEASNTEVEIAIATSTNSTSNPAPAAVPTRAEDTALMPPDLQRILDRGKLIVAVLNEDNPPFFMAGESDALDGSDIQLARDIAQQLGIDVEFQRGAQTFNEVADTVYQRDADMAISKLSRTMQRAQRVRFSRPYLNMRHGLLVNRLQMAQQAKGRSMTEVIRNLEGRVGVIEGSSYVGFTKQKFPKAEVVEYPSWPAVVEAVTQGDILLAYRDELEVKKIVRSQPDAALNFQTVALTDTNDFIAIAVPWESTHLLAFVDQYLETSSTTYTADSLLEQYSVYFQPKPAEES
ncbi:MAG: transporter substrate-binding domain-containing protein [Thainema sp.]